MRKASPFAIKVEGAASNPNYLETICYEAFISEAKLDGKEFVLTVDDASEILTQRVAEFAAVFAECVANIYAEPDKEKIDEHQGEAKDYNYNYLLYLFVGHFSCSATKFDELTLVEANYQTIRVRG
jgi:hypothetical protein